MFNVIQAGIPFLINTIKRAIRNRWLTQTEIDNDNKVIAGVSEISELIADTVSLRNRRPKQLLNGDLPVVDDINDIALWMIEDMRDITTELEVAVPFAKKRESIAINGLTGLVNTIMAIESVIESPSEHHTTHRLSVLRDPFVDGSIMREDACKGVAIEDGFLSLKHTGSNILLEKAEAVIVESNGEPGNPREIKAPLSMRNKNRSNDVPIDLIISTSLMGGSMSDVPGNMTLEEKRAEFWEDSDTVSGDILAIFDPAKSFEVGCIDLQEYTVPVKVITPFNNMRDNIWSPVKYGEALELIEDPKSPEAGRISIFEYTSSKNYNGIWPRHGYGWSFIDDSIADLIDDGTDNSWYNIKGASIEGSSTWIGAPANYAINDVTTPTKQTVPDIISPSGLPYTRGGSLRAIVTVMLKEATEAEEIIVRLGDIARPGSAYHIPTIECIEVQLEDDSWVNVELIDIEESQLNDVNQGAVSDTDQSLQFNNPYGNAGLGKSISGIANPSNQLDNARNSQEYGSSPYNPAPQMQNNVYTTTNNMGPQARMRWNEMQRVREHNKTTSEYQFLKRLGYTE
jgi:hypothetical protein